MRPGVGEGSGCLCLPSPSAPGPAKPQVPPQLAGGGLGRGEVGRGVFEGERCPGQHRLVSTAAVTRAAGPAGLLSCFRRCSGCALHNLRGSSGQTRAVRCGLGPPTLFTSQVLIFGSGALAVFDHRPGLLVAGQGVGGT